jgi:hypothetical protein
MKGDYRKYKAQCKQGYYQIYKDQYKDSPDKLEYWDYRKFLQIVSEEIFNATVNNPDGFQLPLHLGFYKMVGAKLRKPSKASRKIKLQYYFLGATENYIYSLRWYEGFGVKNSHFFKFKTGKLFKSKIYKLIKEEKYLNWIRVDSQIDASKLKP